MGNEAYEKAYCDAREALYNRGKNVGGPQRAVGVRYCPVDGLPLSDRELLIANHCQIAALKATCSGCNTPLRTGRIYKYLSISK